MKTQPPGLLPPTFSAYLKLNAGVFLFIAVMVWLLALILGSARGLVLLGFFLAVGFALVSFFDYWWLRSR